MVKLQKHKAYTYETEKGKKIPHYKHLVVIPENVVSEVGWNEGAELRISVANNSIVITPKESDE
jgi:hypothetical protein